jgi:hypothetical protein
VDLRTSDGHLATPPKRGPRYDQTRDDAMWEAYVGGMTMGDIGKRYGVSAQRVSQILARVQAGFVRCYWCGEKRRKPSTGGL